MRMRSSIASLAGLLLCPILLGACSGSSTRAQSAEISTAPASLRSTAEPQAKVWMHPDVAGAWAEGHRGDGATITVIDDFSSTARLSGNLGLGTKSLRHGEWVQLQAHMVAPEAWTRAQDFESKDTSVRLAQGLNVINASFTWQGPSGQDVTQMVASHTGVASVVEHAREGRAVVAKAAGNASAAVGAASGGNHDYLNEALIGQPGAIFVGALEHNGTVGDPARLASYSNYAGTDLTVQQQFVVVGVEGSKTGLYGTSFAAPIVSGYAAIIGSKFRNATAPQIADRLLATARTDTVGAYSASVHGRGEASLSRALAPASIR